MDLSIEQTWEIFEATFVNRDKDHALRGAITVHIYDDDRDLFLKIKGYSKEAVAQTIEFIKSSLPLEVINFPSKESDDLHFSLSSNPNQEEMRSAMKRLIPQMESIQFKLRKLEDTWV